MAMQLLPHNTPKRSWTVGNSHCFIPGSWLEGATWVPGSSPLWRFWAFSACLWTVGCRAEVEP